MKGLFAAAVAGVAAASVVPQFSQQWSSYTVSTLLQDQGSFQIGDNWCCSPSSPQCQIQYQMQGSLTYFDGPNNRTASVYGAAYQPYAIITLINADGNGGEYAVDQTGACQSYCPAQGPMEPFNVEGYTDMGAVNINGRNVELWQSVTTFPILNVTMETDNLYVDQSNPSNAFPVIDIDDLTPFGNPIGQSNTTYQNWKTGPSSVPASVFNVTGIAACPLDKSCNGNNNNNNNNANLFQLHRLRTKQHNAYWHSYLAAQAAEHLAKGQRFAEQAKALRGAAK